MTIDEMIKQLTNLPPAPRVLPKLIRLLNDVDSSTDDIVGLIELDASLTAEIIAISNSAMYCANERIMDLIEAVNRLGFKEIYRVVTNICARSFVGSGVASFQISADERWVNSVSTGLVMEWVAKETGRADASVAYTIGLLHDIGKTAMNQVYTSEYDELLQRVENEGLEIKEAEQQMFGFDHAQVGAALLTNWNFPSELVEPIEFQYEPSGASVHQDLTMLLHLSRWISAGIGGAPGKNAWAFQFHESILEKLGLDEMKMMSFMIECKEMIREKEELLSL